MSAPCILCREPLPAMYGGTYPPTPKRPFVRIYVCPLCVTRHGEESAWARARSVLQSLAPREVTP